MTTALLRTRLALGVYNWEVWLNAVIEQGNSVDHKTVHHFLPIYSWFRVSIHAAYPRPSWIVSKGDYSKAQQQRTGNIITQHLFFFHTHSNKKENLHSCNIKRSWNATGKKKWQHSIFWTDTKEREKTGTLWNFKQGSQQTRSLLRACFDSKV